MLYTVKIKSEFLSFILPHVHTSDSNVIIDANGRGFGARDFFGRSDRFGGYGRYDRFGGYGRYDRFGGYRGLGGYSDYYPALLDGLDGSDNFLYNGNYPSYSNDLCNCGMDSNCRINCHASFGYKFQQL